MKLNNKGFAVTVILYSVMSLAILVFFLSIAIQRTSYVNNNKLVDSIKNSLNDKHFTPSSGAEVYGLRIDFTNLSDRYTRLDDSIELCGSTNPCAAVGTDTLNPMNKFDEAEIFGEIEDVIEDGNHFVKIPKFYIKKTVLNDGDIWELRVSKEKKDPDYYLPNVFEDHATGTELNYVLIGKYTAHLEGGKLGSKPGTTPAVSTTLPSFRDQAKANGAGYQLLDIHAIDVIQTLFHIEFATLNSQDIMYGYAFDNPSLLISGETDTVLSSSGSKTSNTTGKFAMMYRGIENIYGNVFEAVDGINIQDRIAYVSENPSTYESDKFDGAYKKVGYTNATSNNYAIKMGYDKNYPYANFPIEIGAIGNSLYKDVYFQDAGNRVAIFGGHWNNGTYAGLSLWNLNDDSSGSASRSGARVLKTAS